MPFLPQDEPHLQRALTLAADAAAFASPNPTVGCVLMRDEQLLGEGAHHYDARDHAEIAALKDAAFSGYNVQGATAYVTLEPCSHHGRTGPCSDALIAAGIARCVVATVDPNPQVARTGIARLRAAGIDTIVVDSTHALAQQARRLNDAFAFSIRHGRPFVTLKSALSVDGKIAPHHRERKAIQPVWLTGEEARADVQRLRHASDAILTGSGTIRMDNPSLTDRTGLPRRRPLLRVVLDSALSIHLGSNILHPIANDLTFFVQGLASADSCDEMRSLGAEVIVARQLDSGWMELNDVLQHLHQKHIRSVLIEAGSAINGAFLKEDLVDRVILYYSETELGNDAVPFADGISPFTLQGQLQPIERESFFNGTGEDVRISGYIHDPWSNI